jgi:hypothetical protein
VPDKYENRKLVCTIGGLCDGRKWQNSERGRHQSDGEQLAQSYDEFHDQSSPIKA